MGFVEGHLASHLDPLLGAQRRRVELIPEDTKERDGSASRDRRQPAGLVVRDGRHVGTHRALGIEHRGAPLDLEALDRVRVVACPGLRGVGQHSRVEPPAAARARLEQDVGEGGREARVQVIDAEDVAVEELALAVGRQRPTRRLGDVPVHVPLDVGDRPAAENLREHVEQVVDDLRPGQVEHVLAAMLGSRPAGHADCPVRMLGKQPAALADHLRLDPQAELHAQGGDLAGQAVDPVGQLAPVDGPVAERAGVVVAGPEPAVVEDEQLDPQVAGDLGDGQQLGLVEVEVGSFPVIDQDRPRPVAPVAPGESLAVQPVIGVAEAAEPLAGPGQDGLGRAELGSRLEGPAKALRVDPEADPGRPVLAHLGLGQEVAGVDETESVGLAGRLGRVRPAQDQRWVMLEPGRATQAAGRLAARNQGVLDEMTLARPGPAQLDPRPVVVGQVQHRAHRGGDR